MRFNTDPRLSFQLLLVCFFPLVLFAPACNDGKSGGSKALAVSSVVGVADDGFVYRNQSIRVEFDTRIDGETVSSRALSVLLAGEIVPGRVEVANDGRSVTWFPTVLPGDRNDYIPETAPPINGLGLAANTSYTLQVLGDSPLAITNRRGTPVNETLTIDLFTTDEYQPEDEPAPPSIDPAAPLAFAPEQIQGGDPTSANPADWPLVEPADLKIEVRFDEALHPSSVLGMCQVFLTNVTSLANPPLGVGEPALIRTALGPDARTLVVEPLLSLGDDPDSSEPYEFEIRITDDVTDLAGNALAEDIILHFRTADRPGEPNFKILTETFDDTTMRQDDTTAEWGDGSVIGADITTRTLSYVPLLPRVPGNPPPNSFNLPHPLVEVNNPATPEGCRFQMRFSSTDVRVEEGELLAGMSWGPKSNFVFQSLYEDITIRVGTLAQAPQLENEFDRNYVPPSEQNPMTVFEGDYSVNNSLDQTWEPWPAFVRYPAWGRQTSLVFEFDMPRGGTTFQLFRNDSTRSFPRNRIFANGGASRAVTRGENTQYDTRFELAAAGSVALSTGYDSTLAAGDYETAVIVTDPSRTGTIVESRFAGSDPGGAPDENDFATDINSADGRAAIAFRLDLIGNPGTGIVPRVLSVHIAVRDPNE